MSSYAAPVTDDLLARLTRVIDAREAMAEDAKDVFGLLGLPTRNGQDTLATFFVANDPSSVIRRCRADRRIVETYRMTVASSDLHAHAWMVMRSVVWDLASAYGVEVKP